MKKSNIFVYAQRHATDVDREIGGLNVMGCLALLRRGSKSDRDFLCIFISTCHIIHIDRPSLF